MSSRALERMKNGGSSVDLMHITDNIYWYPPDHSDGKVQPGVGVIMSSHQTVLVDAGNSPRHAHLIRLALDEIDAPPVRYVIYTHHHWDHTFGAKVFHAQVIAHTSTRDYLAEYAAHTASSEAIEDAIRQYPELESRFRSIERALGDRHGFSIVEPGLTLTDDLRLHVDDLVIDVQHVGGDHAPDSVIVQVGAAGVVFLGDCYYPPPPPQRTPDSTLDKAMIQRLLAGNHRLYIDGHGVTPRSHDEFTTLLAE